MAKKKKTQLKPVTRGFATTSVPKKVVEAEPVEEETLVATTSSAGEIQNAASDAQVSDAAGVVEGVDGSLDPGQAEERALQGIVDKFQEKVEREIVRAVKTVEQEKRFSKSFPTLEVDSLLVQRILDLVAMFDSNEGRRQLDEGEDKALLKLAVTYGTLRRLGFSEKTVEECLKAINGVDLDEAYDWLYLNCSNDELLGTTEEGSNASSVPGTPKSHIPKTPKRTPAEFQAPPTPKHTKKSFSLDANAPVFVPSAARKLPSSVVDESIVPEHDTASDTEIQSDDGDLSAEYVKVKLAIDSLTTHRRSGNPVPSSHLRNLQSRLAALQTNYFFEADEAEQSYVAARAEADAAELRARLRGEETTKPFPKHHHNKQSLSIQTPTQTSDSDIDVFNGEGHSDSDEGGVLTLLEDIPTETTSNGASIVVREMEVPKTWSGRTSKTILADTVAKIDKYAVVKYSIISGSSRAQRAAVSIRWGGKTQEWSMDDVACPEKNQAEQYIATVALHSLSYPPSEGFSSGTPGSQTSFRLLPPAFRDLWSELEEARKHKDEEINRGIWAKLRPIVESKLEAQNKTINKGLKSVNGFSTKKQISSSLTNGVNEDLIADFRAREASPGYQTMLAQRDKLPIAEYRQHIIQTLEEHQVLVLSGETGCGKSTQVPAFILEDQLSKGKNCKIYCTEPRRISAISLAQRVSQELGEPPNAVGTSNSLVGYSIRLESNTSKNTRLAYVTNGIALRMLESGSGHGGQDTAFDEITHIIIDEVHERTIEADFLLIVLKSLLKQKPDLKVILMSATVEADKISEYFGGCPTLHVPGRTFPVDVFYLEDAVEITGFSISQDSPYARRSHDKFYKNKNKTDWSEELANGNGDDDDDEISGELKLEKRYSSTTVQTLSLYDERQIPYDLIIGLLEQICSEDAFTSYSSAILLFMPGLAEIRRLNDLLAEHDSFSSDLFRIYPLHSMLSSENQGAVFEVPPPGIRKIVIATNIAETGITIPDVTCVIDTGKHREMRFDEKRQISRLVETFIAKSNAAQRRGRAGRVQSGICFHLFTKLRHDTLLADNPQPEMLRLSLAELSLRIKIMNLQQLGSSIESVLSSALSPPSSANIQRAIASLVEVRALTPSEDITPMGRLLSKLPCDVHLGKFLLTAAVFRCLDPALTIAATLNSKSPFISPMGLEQEADRAKASFRIENSDFLTLHNAFSSWRRACGNGNARKFCRQSFLSHQNLQQIEELRQQFLGYLIDSSFIRVDKSYIRELNRARYGRHRNPRFVSVPPEFDTGSDNNALVHGALLNGLYPKVLSVDSDTNQMRMISNNQATSFHPTSVNFGRKPTDLGVNHLLYFTAMHSKKLYVWETGPVDDLALLLLCGEADFKVRIHKPFKLCFRPFLTLRKYQLISNSVSIDRKIRFQLSPKANIALKILRSRLGTLLENQFRGKKVLVESQLHWQELAMMTLGKVKQESTPQVII
ncbi:P-loop containing nucleoside triphosphate hydrolase protein [Dendrothele bispora CBS 962.96]|uniref:RNA helicase n=1 Tax=Dendrothele bispora (strain CBS 962.96) TaxID=1314807 RepID=A0A4S8LRW7_DENBC|nr:P-loop containing nucleoside triphosphate hydrolase protein [Dendrothele bispora CBS 962.96]